MTWADIVYFAPIVSFIGLVLLLGMVEAEIVRLLYLRTVLAAETAKLEDKALFIAHSDEIVRRAMTLFGMGCKEEAALELARLGEHAREDLEERGIL